jgi:hypothetical protein
MNTMKAFPSEDHIQHHACLTIAALAKHSESLGSSGAAAATAEPYTQVSPPRLLLRRVQAC